MAAPTKTFEWAANKGAEKRPASRTLRLHNPQDRIAPPPPRPPATPPIPPRQIPALEHTNHVERPLATSPFSLRQIPPPQFPPLPIGLLPFAQPSSEIARLQIEIATLKVHLKEECRRRVETQTKLQLEGVALSTVRKQMAEAMEEGRKKDEKIAQLEAQLAVSQPAGLRGGESDVMKALKKELEQSHGRAVAIIDSALNATEKEQATNQLIASDGSHGGNREARAIANENGAVQATKRGRGRPTKKAERLELAPAKVAKTRGSGIKAPPPIRNNRATSPSNESVLLLGDGSRDERQSIARRVSKRRSAGGAPQVQGGGSCNKDGQKTHSELAPPKKRGRPPKKRPMDGLDEAETTGRGSGATNTVAKEESGPTARKKRKSLYGRP